MWPLRFTPTSEAFTSQSRSPSLSSSVPHRLSQPGPNSNSHPRPQFSPRSSSLTVSAKFNASTSSLNSPRFGAGSSLRQEVSATPDVEDPLVILETVIGRALQKSHGVHEDDVAKRPDVMFRDIRFGNLNLKDFVSHEDVDPGTNETAVDGEISLSVQEYEIRRRKFEHLHDSILTCDEILKSVEISLTRFQKDLGTVSAEIETLQNRSAVLNTKLENRKIVEKLLGPALEDISISPAVVRKLSEDPIDQDWVNALGNLEMRSRAIEQRTGGGEQILAMSDLNPLLEDLTNISLERIRDFFVLQIKALRSPNINAQIIQQRAFLAYKDLFTFMAKHHSQLAEEIMRAYANTMRWYYSSNFTRYMQALDKIPSFTIDKSDALGNDQANNKGPLAPSGGVQKPPNPFSLGRRSDVLKRSAHAALPSHVAVETKSPAYIETSFSALTTAITDNASAEYAFLTSFLPAKTSFATLSHAFASIFSPTFDLGHVFIRRLIDSSYDCLGLLLCVRITQLHAFSLQRRKCPVADAWINGTNMLLWPRFQVAMDVHVESVKRSKNILSSGSRATLSLTSSKADDGKGSTAPHPLTQRFGQLMHGILAVSNNDPSTNSASNAASTIGESVANSDTEPVGRSLDRLRAEVESFLLKIAKGLGPAKKERFLTNNYSLILTIIGDTHGTLAREQREWLEEKKDGAGLA